MNTHLTDIEIQQQAEESGADKAQRDLHLEACVSCRAKYMMYRLLFEQIHISPAPPIPSDFQARVMEMAARKQEQKIIFFYHLLFGMAVCASLIAILLMPNSAIIWGTLAFHSVSSDNINVLEVALAMAAIAFFYICLNGYKIKFKRDSLLSDITF